MFALHPLTDTAENALNYTVRVSTRARRVCLRVTHRGHVEVVVPHGFDPRRIAVLVRSKQAWIEATLQRMSLRRNAISSENVNYSASDALPDTITLPAIAERWEVIYTATDAGQDAQVRRLQRGAGAAKPRITLTIDDAHTRLVLRGNINSAHLCKAALRRWLLCKARHHLAPWLEKLSNEMNLPFNQVRMRSQKTRWGSCSRKKNININCKLLFLPAPLVQCVLVHELCHTVHMNHSPKFWALMKKMQPDYSTLDVQLRNTHHWVPGWIG